MRVLGADGHLVAVVGPAADAGAAEDDAFAQGLAAALAGEGVVDLEPILAHAAAEVAGLDGTHVGAVEELMVHVHQVLVHEAVMAADRAAEPPGFVVGVGDAAEAGQRVGFGARGVTGEDEDEAALFLAGVGADAVR